jgi:SAM domain (Sterile alpha motif)/PH domain
MIARTPMAALANAAAGYTPQRPESDYRSTSTSDNQSEQSLTEDTNSSLSSAISQVKPSQNAFARRNQVSTTRSLSLGSATHVGTNPVMNETLSVIEEHITDMHTPRQSFLNSTYNNQDDDFTQDSNQRLSYINGNETDEEDVSQFTEREVREWTPSQVAEHLEQLGADRSHCEVFKEQEISGEVLLEMDKDTILLKEFELGTLGRRLTLWKKVQNFQIEVKGTKQQNKTSGRTTAMTNRSSSGGPVLPKIPSLNEPSGYGVNRQRAQSASTHEIGTSDARHSHISRPSASSVHSVPHSRRHSSMDIGSFPVTPNKPPRDTQQSPMHVKQGSFDRTWTMGSQTTAVPDSHPSTASGVGASPSADSSFLAPQSPDYNVNPTSAVDLERGYFSSNENESRRFRNVLRKRDSGTHARAPSDSHGSLRLSGVFRHSRTGSTDSLHDSGRQSLIASIKRLSGGKNASTTLVMDDAKSIDAIANSPTTIDSPVDPNYSPVSTTKPKPIKQRILGLRHISDAVTGHEKSAAKQKGELFTATAKEPITTPARTDSSNQSITSTGPSGSIDEKKPQPAKYIPFPALDKASKRKHKHETSAYLRGLEKKSPSEQIAGSDYSGWMKKKSRKLGKWHSRLFVLRGCRLSYYYTEDDMEEKGLIDIAFHRVLPANKDLLTGFHATLTGAGSSPVSPSNATLQTAAQIDLQGIDKDDGTYSESGIFIFKLVPPRPGVSKAVNFTEPKVHFFAVSSVQEGRKWMAALMKATIERDERKLISSTYKEKTISLGRARELRVRPQEFQPTVNEEGEIVDSKTTDIKLLKEGEDDVENNGKTEVTAKDDKDDQSEGWSLVNGSVDGKATEAGLAGKSILDIS